MKRSVAVRKASGPNGIGTKLTLLTPSESSSKANTAAEPAAIDAHEAVVRLITLAAVDLEHVAARAEVAAELPLPDDREGRVVRARVDERSQTGGDVQPDEVVAAQERLVEEVDVDLAVAQHGELVVLAAAAILIGPQSPVASISARASGFFFDAQAGGGIDLPDLEDRAGDPHVAREEVHLAGDPDLSPAARARPRWWRAPRRGRSEYISKNASADVAVSMCSWPASVTLIAPVIEPTGGSAPAQSASVGTPPGGAAAEPPSMLT